MKIVSENKFICKTDVVILKCSDSYDLCYSRVVYLVVDSCLLHATYNAHFAVSVYCNLLLTRYWLRYLCLRSQEIAIDSLDFSKEASFFDALFTLISEALC